MGSGGRSAMAGPVFHYNNETAGERALPPYYDGKVMIYEWARNRIQLITLDENGGVLKIDPFLLGFRSKLSTLKFECKCLEVAVLHSCDPLSDVFFISR